MGEGPGVVYMPDLDLRRNDVGNDDVDASKCPKGHPEEV